MWKEPFLCTDSFQILCWSKIINSVPRLGICMVRPLSTGVLRPVLYVGAIGTCRHKFDLGFLNGFINAAHHLIWSSQNILWTGLRKTSIRPCWRCFIPLGSSRKSGNLIPCKMIWESTQQVMCSDRETGSTLLLTFEWLFSWDNNLLDIMTPGLIILLLMLSTRHNNVGVKTIACFLWVS